MSLSTSDIHELILKNRVLPYAYTGNKTLREQQIAIEECFRMLVNVPEKQTQPKPIIEFVNTSDERFDEIRFRFESEPDFYIPAHMLLPKHYEDRLPVVICLQGHSTGMHISLGRVKFPGDEKTISGGDRDFAIQAVARGYAAIAMEQRGFGELVPSVGTSERCAHVALTAFELGRTLAGERISDVSRLIDAIADFEMLDLDRIGLMGNSGGGTATYHTACLEKRVKVAMPSCAFCTFAGSIMAMRHCYCNYIPGILKYMEQPDEAVMIAPRPLIIVAGREDRIFPIDHVLAAFEKVKAIYAAAGAPDNCRLVIGEEGHRFYAAQAWPVFEQYI